MIAGWHSRSGRPYPQRAVARALEQYRPLSLSEIGQAAATVAGEGVGSASGGFASALYGWLDNRGELRAELAAPDAGDPELYAAAVARWGDDADRHLIGSYAAITALHDGSLRLARSPWRAPPIHYFGSDGFAVASPLLRVLFTAGAPRELEQARVIDELAYDWRIGHDESWYCGIRTVPLGAVVRIDGARVEKRVWYGAAALPAIRRIDDAEALETADALLDEAAARALDVAGKPALALSGGLDSPMVADALLRAMPADARLPTVTFLPHPDWDGRDAPGTMGDEGGWVRALAQAKPRLDPHFADPLDGGFDRRAREVFAAMDLYAPGLANVGMMHGAWARAKELGCDWLLDAGLGNVTFSDGGPWYATEYLLRGKWGQLRRLLASRPGDARPLWRKGLALSVLPWLPAPLRRAARALVHPGRRDRTAQLTLLSPQALERQRARAGSRPAWDDFAFARTRAEAARRELDWADGPGFDVDLAFEQIYGLRHRDVTAYRPLIEFCLSLPTEQFAHDGEHRRLARRMARRRLPEAHARNALHGQHNVDWHARMTPRRAELIAYAEAMRGHPWLSETLDIDRLCDLLEDWPDAPTFDEDVDWPRQLAIPRAVLAAQFIAHVEKRNDL